MASKTPPDEVRCCSECGIDFPERARGRVDYVLDADGNYHCREKKYCRARSLPLKVGTGNFAQIDRAAYLYQMDVRPDSYKTSGWRPIHSWEERVEAGIIYHSLCFPVCMPYACELNSDDSDVVYDPRQPDGIKFLTRERLASILNMAQQHVSQGAQRLVRRRRIHIDEDGRLFFLQHPEITLIERSEIFVARTAEKYQLPPGLIRKFERKLAAKGADEDTCARVFEQLLKTRTGFLQTLREARYEEKEGYLKVSTWLDHHIVSSTLSKLTFPPPSSSVEVAVKPERVSTGGDGGPGRPTLNELYEAGLGKGALSKLPSPRPENAGQLVSQTLAADETVLIDERAATQIYEGLVSADPSITAVEAAELIRMKMRTIRKMILDGKIGNLPAYLIKFVPMLVPGPHLAEARKALSARSTVAAGEQEERRSAAWAREQAVTERVDQQIQAMGEGEWGALRQAAIKEITGDPQTAKQWNLRTAEQKSEWADTWARRRIRDQVESELDVAEQQQQRADREFPKEAAAGESEVN